MAKLQKRWPTILRFAALIPLMLAGSVALYFGVLYIWQSPVRQVEDIQKALPATEKLDAKERAELINKYRGTTTSGIGTVATIFGGLGLFINIYIASKKLNLDTQKISADHLLAESRLTAERFTQAVEQLGNESIHIRLGGIYALEQLAKDSPEDHWTVMEVLTAFIREESPRQKTPEGEEPIFTELRTDIQAAVRVIVRRETKGERVENRLDLSKTNLFKADLSRANLSRANLRGANLQGADLSETILFKSNLFKVNLQGANLRGANLQGAQMLRAQMQGADLRAGANLRMSNLRLADLSKAYLLEADLCGASMFKTNLCEAALREASLTGANLRKADLTGADLSKADLGKADLTEAVVTNAKCINSTGLSETKKKELLKQGAIFETGLGNN